MDFLKRLFGGGGGGSGERDNAMYFYVRPRGCDEVVRMRVDRHNDISLADDMKTYYLRKLVRGQKCFNTVEVELFFDSNRNLADNKIQGGELLKREDYEAWVASQEKPAEA